MQSATISKVILLRVKSPQYKENPMNALRAVYAYTFTYAFYFARG